MGTSKILLLVPLIDLKSPKRTRRKHRGAADRRYYILMPRLQGALRSSVLVRRSAFPHHGGNEMTGRIPQNAGCGAIP